MIDAIANYSCVVVGAGISGLSAAYGLRRRGADVLLVEAGATVGGAMQSETTADGFVLEHGPNTVVSNDPDLWQTFADLGIADERIVAGHSGKRRYILFKGAPEPIPMSPPALIRTPLLSPIGKLRVLAEPLLPRATTPDESVFAFFSRRVGRELAERLVDPFVSGVYAGNPHELSVKSAFGRLWEAEQGHGSIVRGMLAGPRPKKKGGKRELFSFTQGLGTWTQAIARFLGPERVWTNTSAVRLRRVGAEGWQVTLLRNGAETVVQAAQVVLAVPAFVAADLAADLDPAAAAALKAIPYPPMAVVHLAYRRADVAHPLDGFGMLCPSGEGRTILGSLWPASLFEGRTPADIVLTTVFVGGARMPEQALLDDPAMIAMVQREQQAVLGVRGDPTMARVVRWPRAIPQYVAGHSERITAVERMEAVQPGLHLLGNYRDGISTVQCWQNGQTLAARIDVELAAVMPEAMTV